MDVSSVRRESGNETSHRRMSCTSPCHGAFCHPFRRDGSATTDLSIAFFLCFKSTCLHLLHHCFLLLSFLSSFAFSSVLTCHRQAPHVSRSVGRRGSVRSPPSREETPESSLPSLGCERHNAGGDWCREGKRPSRSHGWGPVGDPGCGEDTPSPARGWVWTLPRNPTDKLPSDVGGAGKQVRCIGCDEEVGCTVICGTGTCPGRRRRKDGSMLVRGIRPIGRDPNTTSKRRGCLERGSSTRACDWPSKEGEDEEPPSMSLSRKHHGVTRVGPIRSCQTPSGPPAPKGGPYPRQFRDARTADLGPSLHNPRCWSRWCTSSSGGILPPLLPLGWRREAKHDRDDRFHRVCANDPTNTRASRSFRRERRSERAWKRAMARSATWDAGATEAGVRKHATWSPYVAMEWRRTTWTCAIEAMTRKKMSCCVRLDGKEGLT